MITEYDCGYDKDDDLVVTTPLPPPSRGINASDILKAVRNGPPRCVVCNADIMKGKPQAKGDESRWCENCRSFEKVYRGPPRSTLCGSCFNNVDGKCAAMMYQVADGSWRDRYNQAETITYREGGVYRDVKPILPKRMTKPQYVCECYEPLADGETRESIRIRDPLRFYNKTRFWD